MPVNIRKFPKSSTPKILQRHISTTSPLSREHQFRRSDFSGQGYSASYEPHAPTVGPLAQASKHGAPRLTPSMLKDHLDKFIVGQDKAKKVTSVAVYNHYQRIRELRRQENEEADRQAQRERRLLAERERNSHPVENEFPGHVDSVDLNYRVPIVPNPDLGSTNLSTANQVIIEKSNLLLLGPSGVGKTYILSTLARILEVPFATIDCSSLTAAGYIGTDIESSLERLLLAANLIPSHCESGILFFDELDKLARPAVVSHGRDVGGESVQQGLLKMIEGTTVTVNVRGDKNRSNERGGKDGGRDSRDLGANSGGKGEQFTIDTSNILFVFAGAFVGLERIVSSRLSSGTSIGFGAELNSPTSDSNSKSNKVAQENQKDPLRNLLPQDLQSYGLIPELLGRIPILTSLSPLSLNQLVSILTEPTNSLVAQYVALLATSGIQLRFSTGALHAIAERALALGSPIVKPGRGNGSGGGGIGARGLRSVMESVLGEVMFWGPGSSVRFVLIDEEFVRGFDEGSSQFVTKKETGGARKGGGVSRGGEKAAMPRCWSRGQGGLFDDAWEKEEEVWRARVEEKEKREREEEAVAEKGTFEQYREVGSSGM